MRAAVRTSLAEHLAELHEILTPDQRQMFSKHVMEMMHPGHHKKAKMHDKHGNMKFGHADGHGHDHDHGHGHGGHDH